MEMDLGRERGSRRRNAALVLIVLVAFVLIAAYSALSAETGGSSASTTTVETVASPGTACTDPSVSAMVVQVEEDPKFVGLSGGLCYSFLGAESTNTSAASYTFDYYNGPAAHPCGNAPAA